MFGSLLGVRLIFCVHNFTETILYYTENTINKSITFNYCTQSLKTDNPWTSIGQYELNVSVNTKNRTHKTKIRFCCSETGLVMKDSSLRPHDCYKLLCFRTWEIWRLIWRTKPTASQERAISFSPMWFQPHVVVVTSGDNLTERMKDVHQWQMINTGATLAEVLETYPALKCHH